MGYIIVNSKKNMEIKNKKNLELLKSSETLYTCHKCNKIPQIIKIDYMNSEIELKCEEHQITTLKIKEYLESISKLKKCQKCCKECINVYPPLKYCASCQLILCNICALDHLNSNHDIFNNDEYNIKCKKHLNYFYEAYCDNCKRNICKECKKSGIHIKHNKFDFIEIQPSTNNLEVIYNFDKYLEKQIKKLDYKKFIEALEKEKHEKISLINSEHIKRKKEIENKYLIFSQKFMEKLNKEKNLELSTLDEQIRNYINELTKKIQNQIQEYEKQKKIIENYNEIIKLHNIIINSYKKQGEYNLYYNQNINCVIENIKAYNEYINKKDNINLNDIIEKYEINIDKNLKFLKAKNDQINNELLNNIMRNCSILFKEINISSKNINSIKFLEKNTEKLEHLLIVDCPINDINIMININLSSLIELKISNAKISNINFLTNDNIQRLKVLNLEKNEISNINTLQNIRFSNSLEELYISHNKIIDISVFNYIAFPKLKILFLSHNQIENISPIKLIIINSCQTLSLDNNKIKDIELFKDINRFNNLKNLSLKNNLIDINNEINRNIFKLIKDKKINCQY